jgi:hypothetical protein
MDVDTSILDLQSTLTRLDPFKHAFPSFDNVLDVYLPYDITIPGQDFVKGADQVAFTEEQRKEIRSATANKVWRLSTISAINKLVHSIIIIIKQSLIHI